jgi:uncharacterized membrane protein YqhA
MLNNILRFRYIFLITVFFSFLNSIFFLIGGAMKCLKGYKIFLQNGFSVEGHPGLYLLEGLDFFLVSMVFLIFGLGVLNIFISYHKVDENLPDWLKIGSFMGLKILLWETVLVTLVVYSFTVVIAKIDALQWNILVLPGVILILTIAIVLLKRTEKH